jgi:hypothetical protein
MPDDFKPLGPAITKIIPAPAPVYRPVGGRPGILEGPDGKWVNVAPTDPNETVSKLRDAAQYLEKCGAYDDQPVPSLTDWTEYD